MFDMKFHNCANKFMIQRRLKSSIDLVVLLVVLQNQGLTINNADMNMSCWIVDLFTDTFELSVNCM